MCQFCVFKDVKLPYMHNVDIIKHRDVFRYCPFCSSHDSYQPTGKQENGKCTQYITCTVCKKQLRLVCSHRNYQYMNGIYPVGSKLHCSTCPNGQIAFGLCLTCKRSATPTGCLFVKVRYPTGPQ